MGFYSSAPDHHAKCDFCLKDFIFDGDRGIGCVLHEYGDLVSCPDCLAGNHDGWGPHDEKVIIKRCKERGIPLPPRNEKEWLPQRVYRSSI